MARQDFRRFPPLKRCRLEADRPVSAVRLGLGSVIRLGLAPLGRRATRFHRGLDTAERQACGLILILPGIEGCSSVNDSIARGLSEAGCEAAIRIEDWRRFRPWNPLHLATLKHNRGQAMRIAAMISTYCCEFPGRPVHIIGHSAGAGMALFVLESLPEDCGVDSVLLLAAAVSRHYPLTAAAARIRGALWNFFSPLDLPTVGFGTTVLEPWIGDTRSRPEPWASPLAATKPACSRSAFARDAETVELRRSFWLDERSVRARSTGPTAAEPSINCPWKGCPAPCLATTAHLFVRCFSAICTSGFVIHGPSRFWTACSDTSLSSCIFWETLSTAGAWAAVGIGRTPAVAW